MDSQWFYTILNRLLDGLLDGSLGLIFAVAVAVIIARYERNRRAENAKESLFGEAEMLREHLEDQQKTNIIEPIKDTPIWNSIISSGDILLIQKAGKKSSKKARKGSQSEIDYDACLEIYAAIHKIKELTSKGSKAADIQKTISGVIGDTESQKDSDIDDISDDKESGEEANTLALEDMVKILEDTFKKDGKEVKNVNATAKGAITFTTENLRKIAKPQKDENRKEAYYANYFIDRKKGKGISLNLWTGVEEKDISNSKAKDELRYKYNKYLRASGKRPKTDFRRDMSVGVGAFAGISSKTRENIEKEEFEKIIKTGVDYDNELGKKLRKYNKSK